MNEKTEYLECSIWRTEKDCPVHPFNMTYTHVDPFEVGDVLQPFIDQLISGDLIGLDIEIHPDPTKYVE